MILKDNQGKDRIKFSDIVRLNKEEPVFIKMEVHISTETQENELMECEKFLNGFNKK